VFEVGDIVAGKYRVERELGRGGMGMVVAATHIHLGTTIALKFLSDKMMEEPQVVARFLREARASAQLRNEHICRILDFGTEGEVPYIVMELLEGCDLGKLVRQHPLDTTTAADYVIQACQGLAEAHAAQVVHRDLKPSNLFLTHRPDGSSCVKVFDFGVAKVQQTVDVNLTTTASVVGSPGYMSPEQVRASKNVDARSDIWALGVILYKLVSTRMPFKAESITDLAVAIAMDPTPPLGNVAPAFEAIVMKCLEKDPARRYQHVGELIAALTPFAEGRDTAPFETPLAPQSTTFGPAMLPPPSIHDSPTTLRGASGVIERIPERRNIRPWVIGGALSVVVGIVVGLTWTSGATAPTPTTQPMVPTAVETMPLDHSAPADPVVAKPAVVTTPAADPVVETAAKPAVDPKKKPVAPVHVVAKPADPPPTHVVTKPADPPPAKPKPKDPKDIGASRI
jgi:serine/threonine-protein kinase